jgi:hypothetical protein
MTVNYDKCPRHEDAVRRYVESGKEPGDFLRAVLGDSLSRAVGRADAKNKELLEEWVLFVYNELPASCWGSEQAVEQWMQQGGLNAERTQQPDA